MSGMASLGFVYLLTSGLIVMIVLAVHCYRKRSNRWYRGIFLACIGYFLDFALIIIA